MKYKRPSLKDFGSYLRKLREQQGFAQLLAADKLSHEIEGTVSQSLVTQLESGTARNPDISLLRAVAEVYDVSYSDVISELVKDKYQLEALRADRLKDEIRTIDQLAEWEREAKPNELWIVAPNFVDDTNLLIAKTVIDLLKNGTNIKYFVNESDTMSTGRFASFKRQVIRQLGELYDEANPQISAHGLTPHDIAWLSTSFVIANPRQAISFESESEPSSGYYVLPEADGRPSYGLAISERELARLALNLIEVIDNTNPER